MPCTEIHTCAYKHRNVTKSKSKSPESAHCEFPQFNTFPGHTLHNKIFFFFCSISTPPCFKSSNSQVNTTLGRSQELVSRTFHIFIISQVRWFAANEQDSECSDIERDRKVSKVLLTGKPVTKKQFCTNVCCISFWLSMKFTESYFLQAKYHEKKAQYFS